MSTWTPPEWFADRWHQLDAIVVEVEELDTDDVIPPGLEAQLTGAFEENAKYLARELDQRVDAAKEAIETLAAIEHRYGSPEHANRAWQCANMLEALARRAVAPEMPSIRGRQVQEMGGPTDGRQALAFDVSAAIGVVVVHPDQTQMIARVDDELIVSRVREWLDEMDQS